MQPLYHAVLRTCLAVVFSMFASGSPVHAQKAAPAKPQPTQQSPAPGTDTGAEQQSNWRSGCASIARGTLPDCTVEQRLVLSNTGQLLAAVTIRIDGKSRQPALMVQLPHGLFLPDGITLAVDQEEVLKLELQTCDSSGCYAGAPASKKLLDAMASGSQFRIAFKNLARKDLQVVMPLTGFAAALANAK